MNTGAEQILEKCASVLSDLDASVDPSCRRGTLEVLAFVTDAGGELRAAVLTSHRVALGRDGHHRGAAKWTFVAAVASLAHSRRRACRTEARVAQPTSARCRGTLGVRDLLRSHPAQTILIAAPHGATEHVGDKRRNLAHDIWNQIEGEEKGTRED